MSFIGDIFGGLFGGSEGSVINPPPPETKAVSTATAEQQELLKKLISDLGGLGGFSPTDLTPPGGFVAPLSGGETRSLDALEQASLALAPGGASFEALTGLANQPFDVDAFNEFFDASVATPLTTKFFEETVPDISARFAPSFFSSDRQDAQSAGFEDLLDKLVETRASTAFGAQQAGLDRSVQAAGILPLLLSSLTGTLDAQGLPRGIEQAGITAGVGEESRQLGEEQQFINNLLSILGLNQVENIGSAPVVLAGQEGSGGDVLKSVAPLIEALPILISIFSHSSLKTDIESLNGYSVLSAVETIPIQYWRYKAAIGNGDSERHLGPYAEDFQKLFGIGDGVTINMLDAFGVLLAAVKELVVKVRELEGEA